MPTADATGDYETVDSDRDPAENIDSDDDGNDDDNDDSDDDDDDNDDNAADGGGDVDAGDKDKDDDDDIHPDGADSIDDADDNSDTNFSKAHQSLQGSFKTAEGITITIVKGSIAAQKVCIYVLLFIFCHGWG